MLAYIPQNMSRKRSVPFRAATSESDQVPLPKRSRTTTGNSAASYQERNNGGEQLHSTVDLFVLPRAPRSRRVASLRAQIANTSLLLSEHRQRSRSSSPQEFTSTTSAGEEEEGGGLVIEGQWGSPVVSRGSERPLGFREKVGQPARRESGKSDQAESCASSLSPLSSLGSEWEEEKAVGDSVMTRPKIKIPVLNLVPVVEKANQKPRKSARKPACAQTQGYYVRRMASLNARACVSAMMESMRRPYTRRGAANSTATAATTSGDLSLQSIESQPDLQDGVSPVVAEGSAAQTHTPVESSLQQSCSGRETTPDSSFLSPFLGKGPGYVVLCASPNTLTQCGIIRGSFENSSYNTEGLLWNGDTVHPQARVYLTPEGEVPRLIVPPICPARPHCVTEVKAMARTQQLKKLKRPKAVKGDNGWYVLGDPIKEVLLPHKDGIKVSRKYYAGMRRKNEELWVRDCITVRSGKRKKDRPFIAKIGSIWREQNSSVMMTLFWYYRPEEATGMQTTDFQKDELLASQHYDDNSVACIEDKCYVLGLRQYCRYRAKCTSVAEGIGTMDSFSIIRANPNETGQFEPTTKHKKSTCHVFLCHRGYNHIAGRLLKIHKH